MASLRAIGLNCTLKAGPEPSSTQVLVGQVLEALADHDVLTEPPVRIVDHDVKPGVTSDEGEGDDWPDLRRRILDADILVLGTPIWLGQPSSVAKRVLERMDAFLGETDDGGRMPSYGRAMQGTDYRDLEKVPDAVASATAMAARNGAHLAGLLHNTPYPPAP